MIQLSPIELAIAASAFNVCGKRSGEFAMPSTVLGMADTKTLHGYVSAYAVKDDPDPLFTKAEISMTAKKLEIVA